MCFFLYWVVGEGGGREVLSTLTFLSHFFFNTKEEQLAHHAELHAPISGLEWVFAGVFRRRCWRRFCCWIRLLLREGVANNADVDW